MEKDLKQKAKELVSRMTLEEKAGLCSGKDFWMLKAIERLGLEEIMVTDGPHGLRKQVLEQDNMGLGRSIPAVCFPTASALACSFDRDLAFEIGKAIGEECLQEEVSVILGPGANQKRSPLCGRNFEYFSEDPVVSGEMAASMINGVQSQGIGTSLKHFAVNNQEKRRMTVSTVVDERALRETYLKAYEIAVKKAKPWTIMCAYNRLNGEYCSENEYLLTRILRQEWGFEGLVVSDWGAVNDRVLGVKTGMDLEMPGSRGINDAKIVEAVQNKTLLEKDLDLAAYRVTELILKGMENRKKGFRYDKNAHHELAVSAAEQSAVLLKNEDRLLPGNTSRTAAVIGVFAKEPRYQGAGSSKINPIQVDNALDAFTKAGLKFTYAQGYSINKDANDPMDQKDASLIKEACEAAKGKGIVYLFVGLPEGYESEGFDRNDLRLPENQNWLIEEVAAINPNIAVILIGGAPVELPWVTRVKAILLAYLGGEGSGKAAVNLLLGNAVPCGKLAETWPLRLSDTPAHQHFPGGRTTVEYRESIFVGYRYYDTAGKQVLYPFGHGLSYTDFTYTDLKIDKETYGYGDKVSLTFRITNTGDRAGKGTALLFVGHQSEKVFLPKKELREFVKVSLEPQETKEIIITLDSKDFGYYNTEIKDWYAESGEYTICVGSSIEDCSLSTVLKLSSPEKVQPDLREKAPSYYHLSNQELKIPKEEFAALYGQELPIDHVTAQRPYNSGNTLEDVSHTFIGKIIIKQAERIAKKITKGSADELGLMSAMIKEMPLHAMVTSGEGMISERMLEGMLDLLNGHYVRGIWRVISNGKENKR